jgi:hypothetical protein
VWLVAGASSAAAIGSKTAIYSVKIGSALSRLAGILKSSAKKLWEMAKVVKTITKFTFGAFKKLTIGKSLPLQQYPQPGLRIRIQYRIFSCSLGVL